MDHQYNGGCQRNRRRTSHVVAGTFVVFVFASVLSIDAQQAGGTRSVLDGVYTEAQAERGMTAYAEHCTRCHRDDLRGNPEAMALTGERFTETWREDTLYSLFDHMATRMPREPRITLATPVYVDILAFILQFNGYPPGRQELAAENLDTIYFVDKNGPQPIPNLAIVRVVGCFTAGENGVWTVTRATPPVREREGRTTTPAQLRASAEAQLGDGAFALQNLDYLDGFMPEPYRGHKVQVKGALVRRQTDQRISVTSLETVSTSCP